MGMDALQSFHTRIVRYYFRGPNTTFTLPEDTYECWVILSVDQGRFYYRLGDEEGEAAFGDIVLCPPGTMLIRRALEPISFHFIEFGWTSGQREPIGADTVPGGKVTFQDAGRAVSSLRMMRDVSLLDRDQYDAYREHLLSDLLHLYRMETMEAGKRKKSPDPIIEEAARHIELHAFRNLSLADVAHTFGLSSSRFTRRFAAVTGLSPIEFLTRIRMSRVKTLLLETDLSLDEIAERSGYQNGFYLSRVFTKTMRMNPSLFRKQHRV